MKIPTRDLLGAAAVLAALPSAARADIVISSGATSNVTCSSGVCAPTSSNAVLNVGDLETLLASGNVTLAAAGEPVDVDVDASLSWVSTNMLTLDSYHSINVEQPVAITGGGGLSIVTNDGGSGGEFSFAPATNVDVWSLSSSLTINGTSYTLVGDIATLAADITANPSGSYALAANYNAAPDGTYSASPVSTHFAGNFQGLGNTISNLAISNGVRGSFVGLFAFTSSGVAISNAVLQNATVTETAGASTVGLLIADNEGTLFGDHVGGTVGVASTSEGGGLAGSTSGTILNSSSSANASGGVAGGLVGGNTGTINGCFATGLAEVKKAGSKVAAIAGGLAGASENGAIFNSYATGVAKGSGKTQLGGLVGQFQANTVSTSYSTGSVKGDDADADGGFIGTYLSGTATSSYWDTTTSGTSKAAGNDANLSGVTGETTKQLKAHLPTGFDPTIWAQSKSINNGFPYLIANPPQ